MKLEEAIADVKAALNEWDHSGHLEVAAENLIEAIEEHLAKEEEKRNIYRQAFGFEPIRRY